MYTFRALINTKTMKKRICLPIALSLSILLLVSPARAENVTGNPNNEETVAISADSATLDSIAYYDSLQARRDYQMDSMRQAMLYQTFQHNQEQSSGSSWRWILRLGVLGVALTGLIIRLSTRKN